MKAILIINFKSILSQGLNKRQIHKKTTEQMSLQQRIESMIKRKRQEQLETDLISETNNQQPIKNCSDKLFRLIIKLEESKVKSRKQYPVQVRSRIFIGNYVFASDEDFLTKSNIGLIISCMSTSPVKIFEHIHYEKISIKDQEGEDLLQYDDTVYEMIENHLQNQTTNIYIHCFHGKSRSPALLLMYLARKERQTIDHLLSELKKVYNLAQPNKWFIEQLAEYHKKFHNSITTQTTDKIQQDDLLGFKLQLVQTHSSSAIVQEKDFLGILQDTTVPSSLPDNRQHLLIPQHQKNNSPKKNTQYHLIQIDEDDQNADLI